MEEKNRGSDLATFGTEEPSSSSRFISLYHEGSEIKTWEHPDCLYMIMEGAVDIERELLQDGKTNHLTLVRLESGMPFGYKALPVNIPPSVERLKFRAAYARTTIAMIPAASLLGTPRNIQKQAEVHKRLLRGSNELIVKLFENLIRRDDQFRRETRQLEGENEDLRGQLATSRKKLSTSAIETPSQLMIEQAYEIQSLKQQSAALCADLEASDATIGALQTELEHTQSQLTKLSTDFVIMQNAMVIKDRTLNEEKRRAEELAAKVAELESRLAEAATATTQTQSKTTDKGLAEALRDYVHEEPFQLSPQFQGEIAPVPEAPDIEAMLWGDEEPSSKSRATLSIGLVSDVPPAPPLTDQRVPQRLPSPPRLPGESGPPTRRSEQQADREFPELEMPTDTRELLAEIGGWNSRVDQQFTSDEVPTPRVADIPAIIPRQSDVDAILGSARETKAYNFDDKRKR